MNSSITFALLSLLLALNSNPSLASGRNHTDDTNPCRLTRYSRYVKNACSVTQYQQLCFRTLWPFAVVAENNSSKWARAGVAVTITDTKQILRLLLKTRSLAVGKRERVALSDCRELFVDSLGNLYKSLALLRKLDADSEFQQQMSDLATWLSSALTDEDTCLDGFEETSISSWTVRMIRRRASRCMQLCSNALALLNKLAYDGL
ncbi:Plant invertase/pectin methylesterase inhibitor superfamily protein [Raphanus sativus]|uniref:Pectinesterase inhibitor 6 n=1 Tax=Raphanus sativus TaxID=3726 RepID=A0A6J0N9F6_RAPSA|nr:pectinesterase inhibitor 6 [Raphanus sativus]XP_056856755.1 pectinesterase inhibitor 6-like [Raphanus sativus]KAJ4867261.1 Plant invertase/pectin methylesterase inhibitor superfamily protein [Raphanus sativus]KAJ4870220.1 Plant invertase/pectin methylesterase inhibitor superfamily protein [Raphanus sativus]